MAFPPGQHISHEAGVLLGAWARGDAIETPDKELWDGGRRKANDGRAALKAWRDSLTDDQRRAIRPIGDELNNTAREADRNLEGAAVLIMPWAELLLSGPDTDRRLIAKRHEDWNSRDPLKVVRAAAGRLYRHGGRAGA